MPPNQAPPSSSIYESSNFVVDYGDIYVEIMEECRPFYSLNTTDTFHIRQTPLQPRLEDALKTLETNKKCNVTVSSTSCLACALFCFNGWHGSDGLWLL